MSNFLERIGQDKIEDREEIKSLRQKLAECQATNGKLRKALLHADGYWLQGKPYTGVVSMDALALPNDSTALNELIAERTRVIKEEFERECNDVDWLLNRLGFAGDNFRTDGGSLRLQMLVELFEQFIAERMKELAAEVERLKDCWSAEGAQVDTLRQKNLELAAQRDAAQARIDELMLEYCPDEMTPEQIANWQHHQVPVSDDEQEAVRAAIANCKEQK